MRDLTLANEDGAPMCREVKSLCVGRLQVWFERTARPPAPFSQRKEARQENATSSSRTRTARLRARRSQRRHLLLDGGLQARDGRPVVLVLRDGGQQLAVPGRSSCCRWKCALCPTPKNAPNPLQIRSILRSSFGACSGGFRFDESSEQRLKASWRPCGCEESALYPAHALQKAGLAMSDGEHLVALQRLQALLAVLDPLDLLLYLELLL
jgi:hypothetical protein